MARLNSAWLNFTARGQAWTHFWMDAAVTSGSTPQTLTATACEVTTSAPTAALAAAVALAAGGNAVTVTAPTASPSMAVSLSADVNVVTLSAPTATFAGQAPPASVRRYYRGRPARAGAVMLSRLFYYVEE